MGFHLYRWLQNIGGSLTRYPELWGNGDEDVEQHWYLCEAIWRPRGTPDATKRVEFQTTLRGRSLRWYIQFVDSPAGGQPFNLDGIKRLFIAKLKLPQAEQQGLTKLRDTKQIVGKTAWEYMQRFKDAIAKLTHPIQEFHQKERYIHSVECLKTVHSEAVPKG